MNSPRHSEKSGPTLTTGEENRLIQRIALYAFAINIILIVLKAIVAYYSNSLAVKAAVIDSASDAAASLAVYLGLKLSEGKSSAFPYGLYKIENMISVGVSLCLFAGGYEIVREVFSDSVSSPVITLQVIGALFAATLIIFFFGRYAMAVGKRMQSPALIAEGRHRQADVLSLVVVLLSVLLNYIGVEFRLFGITGDRMAAVIIVMFIGYAGWELLSDGMRVLLDASLDPGTLDEIRAMIESEPSVSRVIRLTGRNSGRYCFLEAEVALRTDDLKKAEKFCDQIQTRIRSHVPRVERVLIHVTPLQRKWIHYAVPLADTAGRISSHFGEAPYFGLIQVRISDRAVNWRKIVSNPHVGVEKGKGIRVAEWLVDQKVDEIVLKEDLQGKGPSYVFADAGVTIHRTGLDDLERLQEVLDVHPQGGR